MKPHKTMVVVVIIGFNHAIQAQTLLYEWAFTNGNDTATQSTVSYAITPGTGNLQLQNITGNVFTAGPGTDGVNPLLYFTNANLGPVLSGGGPALGALVANGQGYNVGNSAIAIATNLNLGNLNQVTVTHWVKIGPSVVGQFPRFVQFNQNPSYDIGGKGSGNHSDIGSSINYANGEAEMQNSVAGGTVSYGTPVTVTGLSNFPDGLPTDGSTWVFEALTYDATLPSNNFVCWLGTTALSVESIAANGTSFGPINFTTNATIEVGGTDVANTPRGLTAGAIADVRIYSGVLAPCQLEQVRTGESFSSYTISQSFLSQPTSGASYVGGSRTFSVSAETLLYNLCSGGPPGPYGPTYFQWYSNNVAINATTSDTINSSITLTNLQPSANGATFFCTASNYYSTSNSATATLTVVPVTPGSYDQAVLTNNPYSFWLVNELSNPSPVTVFDYANGHDGEVRETANMNFSSGPAAPPYPGFRPGNTSIGTIGGGIGSFLDLANPVNFPNSGMTLCGWVNTPGIVSEVGAGLIFAVNNDSLDGFGLFFGTNNELNYQWGPANTFAPGLRLNTNEWSFVALVISTNSAPNTNATIYVGSPTLGLQKVTDSTALNGDIISSGTAQSVLALGRSPYPAVSNNNFYWVATAQFSRMAVLYSALSPSVITNLYVTGAGVHLSGASDPNYADHLLLTYPLGTLQSAPSVNGFYMTVSGASSPWSVIPSQPQQFYRVVYP